MGTRNLTVIQSGGEYKIAQYGQFDGYPESLGVDLLKILSSDRFNVDLLKKNLQKVKQVDDEFIEAEYIKCGSTKEELKTGFVSSQIVDKFTDKYPHFDRNFKEGILEFIQNSTEDEIKLCSYSFNINFAADSLFCEWVYVIDLDKSMFEIYKGFNTEPLMGNERFFSFTEKIDKKPTHSGSIYYPVKFVCSFNLKDLPDVHGFLLKAIPKEKNEES